MHSNNVNQCKQARDDLFPYVYALYTTGSNSGAVAVIDPTTDKIIRRIPGLINPTAMCIDPSGKNLYVLDAFMYTVNIYRTSDFSLVTSPIRVGTTKNPGPVTVFVDPSGTTAYVANYTEHSVTIIDIDSYEYYTEDIGTGKPFAFASTDNSGFASNSNFVACKGDNFTDSVVDIEAGGVIIETLETSDYSFDVTHNPLAAYPIDIAQGSIILAAFGLTGSLINLVYDVPGTPNSISLLDNTVSGVSLDNKWLFCTVDDRNYLKLFKNLAIDSDGNITYDSFKEIASYRGQDIIRTSQTQKYVCVTILPTYYPVGGLQIIDVDSLSSKFVELNNVGDMTIFSDTKAYVSEINTIRPIDLATATALPAIDIGISNSYVKKIISGYSNQSS
ncbi:YncE family protein [Paenibacillus piscarius]|uniref:YncE family protein n=1 Tax=Paenibacillus piscarius TaxID=1089681 RepID=UPI001EE7BCF8|nr:beta-propeller fold lactonase family protein [Paenibacillus piscarius]